MSVLQLERVVKHYSDADDVVRAVDGVNLSVRAGEMVALYGPSGSGKSTLLLLAAGLLPPDGGRVRFMGEDLGEMSNAQLIAYQRRNVGIVYQSAHLISGLPAWENASIKLLIDGVKLRDARKAAVDWLARVGLEHRLEYTPDRMSGGERQRVAIVRALVNGPRLILADEPTGSLDKRRGLEILRLLSEVARERNTAVLLVTHDPRAAHVADRVLALCDGKLVRIPSAPAEDIVDDLPVLGVSRALE